MTALATPAPPAAARRPARPHLLRWLIRLHRPALLVWLGSVVVLGALLLWLGGPLTDASAAAWKQYDACSWSSRCTYDMDAIGRYKDWYTYTTIAVLAVPFLAAAWSGAALVSRELEQGTAQLAWTQSVSPARWLAFKLAVPAVVIGVGSGLLVGLHHWAWAASQGRIDTAKHWYDVGTYAANGPATVALALVGLAVGVLFGLVRCESLVSLVGALCATAFAWGALAYATPYLWPTATKISSLGHDRPAGSGIVVSQGLVTSSGARIADPHCGPVTDQACRVVYHKLDAVSYFNEYHPQSHYWPLQLTATALLLATAAALTLAAFRLLRRRIDPAPVRRAAAV
ncbi:ABC transporter permease [Streptomyces sp. NPDC096057]|uniref:ABC transporter permease n=1 Tax=Streptomyces sp. NPDC096057 TaxID=3155543 RepID=UPI003328AC3E